MPSPFVAEWLPRVAGIFPPSRPPVARRALDLAMGRGRHTGVLAAAGFVVFGVDISLDAVRHATDQARSAGTRLRAFCADMEAHPLPPGWFDLVLVTRYLDRARMPAILSTVAPGGVIVYETFTRHQLSHGRGPTSPAHLLEPGELFAWFSGWTVLVYEEVAEPEALARLVARRPA